MIGHYPRPEVLHYALLTMTCIDTFTLHNLVGIHIVVWPSQSAFITTCHVPPYLPYNTIWFQTKTLNAITVVILGKHNKHKCYLQES